MRRLSVFDAAGQTICRLAVAGVLLCSILQLGIAKAQDATQTPRSAAQLEQLVAPVALYPDALLSQILMASTYPLEVVEAARWSQTHSGVTGKALEDAMQQQKWDPSVKALAAVPQTLQMMNDKLSWTKDLGDAFLAQQADVLDAVQRLRARADNNGNLKTTDHQTVTKTAAPSGGGGGGGAQSSAGASNVYVVESTNPDQYYVPIYDPGVVYGAWPYADYAPFYWYPTGYLASNVFSFAAGVFVGSAIWGNVDWWRHRVGINPLRYNNFNRTNIVNNTWNHNPAHRGAVPYRDANVAQRFGNANQNAAREAFRNKADAGRRDLGGAGAGALAGAAAGGAAGAIANRKAGGATDRQARTDRGGTDKQARTDRGGTDKQARTDRGGGQAKHAKGGGNRQAQHKGGGGNRQAAHRPATRHAARPSGGHRVSHGGGGGRVATVGRGGGGGRVGGGGGRGRRSDVRLKHDIALLGHLDNGLGFYRFVYNGDDRPYVGVMAQEVQAIVPDAVLRGRDGYLRVVYEKLGVRFQSYDEWIAAGARIPAGSQTSH